MLKIALIINLIIVVLELYTLGHIRGKLNILKYYTYLQNLIALAASLAFCATLMVCMISVREIPEIIKGLRYVATCGLVATAFIFVAFLGAGKKIAITDGDFLRGFSPKLANAILHYVCPALSLISLVLFEREIVMSNGIWTALVAIPSCLYWIVYIVLSATGKWKDPYNFQGEGKNGGVRETLTFVLIPLSFIAISFVLWNIM